MYKRALYHYSNMPLTETITNGFARHYKHISASGQFVEIELPNKFCASLFSLRLDDNSWIYKVVGEGTQHRPIKNWHNIRFTHRFRQRIDINIDKTTTFNCGGVGIPPLYNLAKQLIKGLQTTVALGSTAPKNFSLSKNLKGGCKVVVATIDGSSAQRLRNRCHQSKWY